MTAQEVCEAYMRFIGMPESVVERAARNFFNYYPNGDLWHVFGAYDEMKKAGYI